MKINPFKPAINPRENSYYFFTVYITIFIIRYILVIILLLPRFAIELSIISLVIFITSLVLFLILSQKDPGFLEKDKSKPLKILYSLYHTDYICPFCEVKRCPRTRHCQYCDHCVKGFDHHCPWIHNCVGEKNYALFYFFISLCCIDFLYTSLLGILDYFDLLQNNYKIFELKSYHKALGLAVTAICALGFAICFPIWVMQTANQCKKREQLLNFSFKTDEAVSLQAMFDHGGKIIDSDTLSDSFNTDEKSCCNRKNNKISILSH